MNRKKLFDDLTGNEGIPQMKVELSRMTTVSYVDMKEMDWVTENTGHIQNTSFVIPFYVTGEEDGGKGDSVSMYKARITLLGHVGDGIPSGGVVQGGEITSHIDGHLGMSADESKWSTVNLAAYSYGTGMALQELNQNKSTSLFRGVTSKYPLRMASRWTPSTLQPMPSTGPPRSS
ncbi:hypothetical protein NKH18_45370 [Streptomyces sp. M10(2022)]